MDSDREELELEESEVEEPEPEESEPEESDHQQMEAEANIWDRIQVEVTTRGAIIQERMATKYNKPHDVEIFKVRDIISVGKIELKQIINDCIVELLRSHIQSAINCYQNMAFKSIATSISNVRT